MIGTFAGLIFGVYPTGSIITFADFKKKVASRFHEHEVLGQKPKLEYLGPKLDEITFTMAFNVAWGASPEVMLPLLEDYVRECTVAPLIIGISGIALGNSQYVIKSLGEDHHFINMWGQVEGASVQVTMSEYDGPIQPGLLTRLIPRSLFK